jgi:phosphatidylinositol glycan class T
MPSSDKPGQWTGWWEGVVDLVPPRGGNRDFSIEKLFKKGLPQPFQEAEKSVLRLIMPGSGELRTDLRPGNTSQQWLDGRMRQVVEWDLFDTSLPGSNILFSWDEGDFRYRELPSGWSECSPHFAVAFS